MLIHARSKIIVVVIIKTITNNNGISCTGEYATAIIICLLHHNNCNYRTATSANETILNSLLQQFI